MKAAQRERQREVALRQLERKRAHRKQVEWKREAPYLARALYGPPSRRRGGWSPLGGLPGTYLLLWVLFRLARRSVRAEVAGVVHLVELHRARRAARADALIEAERERRAELARIVAGAPGWADWCAQNGMPRAAVVWESIGGGSS